MHSPDHSTKGTPSALGSATEQWPLTAGEYVVSGSVSSPLRGAFHLSLTVLVHYRSRKILSLGGWSPQLPTRFHVPRGTQDNSRVFQLTLYGTLTLYGLAFQPVRVSSPDRASAPTTPSCPKTARFGLLPVRSPLLRVSRLISLRRATEMFQFTHYPPSLPMCSAGGIQTSLWMGCPIRILKAHRLYAAPLERFAGLRVLLRSFVPRHPPRTLCSLCVFFPWSVPRPSLKRGRGCKPGTTKRVAHKSVLFTSLGLISLVWCTRVSSASILAFARQN